MGMANPLQDPSLQTHAYTSHFPGSGDMAAAYPSSDSAIVHDLSPALLQSKTLSARGPGNQSFSTNMSCFLKQSESKGPPTPYRKPGVLSMSPRNLCPGPSLTSR